MHSRISLCRNKIRCYNVLIYRKSFESNIWFDSSNTELLDNWAEIKWWSERIVLYNICDNYLLIFADEYYIALDFINLWLNKVDILF